MLVTDANQLRQFFTNIGAYSHPEGPPSQPPLVYAPRACEPDGHGVGRGERRPIVELRDRSIRLPRPAPRQRGRRAVVYGGRERYGHEPHGDRPVVRQDARVQGGGIWGRRDVQRQGGSVVSHCDGYHGNVQPSTSEIRRGLVLVRGERGQRRRGIPWGPCPR